MRLALGFLFALLSFGILHAQPVCTFVGDATSLGGDCYEITSGVPWPGSPAPFEFGAVWFNQQLDLTEPFSIRVEANLGDDDNGADGIYMVLHTDAGGQFTLGEGGVGLGYEGIAPSFGVEIDTHFNPDGANQPIGDISQDHVAFQRDGVIFHDLDYFNLAGPNPALPTGANIEDGDLHLLRLEWDPGTQIIEFYFDCELRLTLNIDLVTEIFSGQTDVWWGFTGATGGQVNQQTVCITSSAVGLPPEYAVCQGDEVQLQLTASQPGSVSWSPVDGLSNPNDAVTMASPDVTTTYTATWTDACGEELVEETTVVVTPAPAPVLPDTAAFCPGEEVELEVVLTGDETATWSDGTLGATWTGTDVGVQTVTVEAAGGCSATASTWVEALYPSDIVLPVVPDLCAGQDTLLAWPNGGTDWAVNGDPMPAGWLAVAGEAIVTALDAATGCAVEETVDIGLIDPQPAALPLAVPTCVGQPVVLELTMDAGSTVSWSPVAGLDDPGATQPTASPATTTLYTASVLDICGTVTELETNVVVFDQPELDLPDSALLCGSEDLLLEVEPLAGVSDPVWTDGSTGWQWQGSAPGWVGVTVTVLPGCSGSDSTWVAVESLDPPTIEVDPLCPGDFAFVPFPEGWVNWSLDGEPLLEGGLTVTEPGVYFVDAETAQSGCGVQVGIVVPTGAVAQMGLPDVVEFCIDQVVYLETGVPDPVLWNDGVTGPSRQVNAPGTYIATHTTDCGSVSDTVSVVEIPCGCLVFAPSAFTPDGDLINDAWRPSLDCEPEEYSLKIFDRWGVLIWETVNPEEYWTGGYRADNRPLEEKLYYVRDGLYAFQLTFRDPTSRVRRIEQKRGHILIIR